MGEEVADEVSEVSDTAWPQKHRPHFYAITFQTAEQKITKIQKMKFQPDRFLPVKFQ